MAKGNINYLTTLHEKELFVQNFVCADIPIKDIYYFMGSIIAVDLNGNCLDDSSKKFMHYCNESLLVARRQLYHSIEEFMNEYKLQRIKEQLNPLKELPLSIKQNQLYKKLQQKYPNMDNCIFSGNEIAVIIPNEETHGKTIFQCREEDIVLSKSKKK